MATSSAETEKIFNNTLMFEIRRTAIDSNGRIGSLYDASRDRLIGQLNVDNQEQLDHMNKSVQGEIKYVDDDQPPNLLRQLSINEQLRLSILLNLVPSGSIASIVDYPHLTNEHTRLFCYAYVDRVQRLPCQIEEAKQFINSSMPSTAATHIITGIEWGIDLVVILQLPSDENLIKELDPVLDKLLNFLVYDDDTHALTSDEETLLEKIVHTKIYANSSTLSSLTTIRDVCHCIKEKSNSIIDCPVSYTLRPINWLYPEYTNEDAIFNPLSSVLNYKFEKCALKLTAELKRIDVSIIEDTSRLLGEHWKEQYPDVEKQWDDVKDKFISKIKQLSKIAMDLRTERNKNEVTEQATSKNEQTLPENPKDLNTVERNVNHKDIEINHEQSQVEDDQHKLIEDSQHDQDVQNNNEQQQQDINVVEKNVNDTDTEINHEQSQVEDDQRKQHASSSDDQTSSENLKDLNDVTHAGNQSNAETNTQLKVVEDNQHDQDVQSNNEQQQDVNVVKKNVNDTDTETNNENSLVEDKQENQNVCSNDSSNVNGEEAKNNSTSVIDSSDVTIAQSLKDTHEDISDQMSHVSSTTAQISYSPSTEPQISDTSTTDADMTRASSPSSSTSTDETINILLLGETGVGKSTFINAFANYLKFNTLQQAETGHPIVLIPVSFLITVGDNFDEHIVKFGDIDQSKNENFDNPGQSVTQRCQSYIFSLNQTDGKKLCIIDAPGFGDTRGVEQDDLNMQHIVEYIKNLSHLNAICFLLKPNESRLNIFYQSCLIQLSSLLGKNSNSRIMFCFTNARSTFYTPGNTAPLLKEMLSSLSMGDVPFIRDNTFSFDNESFRYLVALQNGISFNEIEKEEYEISWTKSVTESNRLVRYICDALIAHRVQGEEKSI